jgi:hypothetical protein
MMKKEEPPIKEGENDMRSRAKGKMFHFQRTSTSTNPSSISTVLVVHLPSEYNTCPKGTISDFTWPISLFNRSSDKPNRIDIDA